MAPTENTLPAHGAGRVLQIGVSYYNNEYLTQSLRESGWRADLFLSGFEAAGDFVHDLPKQLACECFKPVVPSNPRLSAFCALVLEAVGRSWPQTYALEPRNGLFWEEFTAQKRADLEGLPVLGSAETGKYTMPRLTSLEASCRDYLRKLKADKKADLPDLLQPLASPDGCELLRRVFRVFLAALRPDHPELALLWAVVNGEYDILHFTGVNSMRFLYFFDMFRFGVFPLGWDIALLKRLGLKVVYSNIACFDGVLSGTFRRLEPSVCELCNWNESELCNDGLNAAWGELRNALADYQITLGGNRADYNLDRRIHEVPGFYCLDKSVWSPEAEIPADFLHPTPKPGVVRLYHAVGNLKARSSNGYKNIKCTHIYLPLIQSLREQGLPVELDLVTDIPNREVIWRQLQSDIFCDQLTFGWFGANAREGMMLGKPVICFLRPEWLESVRAEIPEYVAELPIVSATPDTVAEVLVDLVLDKEKRLGIGRQGREFAIKWHDRSSGARQVEKIYRELLHTTGC